MEVERVFWLVWAPDSVVHLQRESEIEACDTAKRLARLAPDSHFYVLKALSKFKAAVTPVDETMLMEPRLP